MVDYFICKVVELINIYRIGDYDICDFIELIGLVDDRVFGVVW